MVASDWLAAELVTAGVARDRLRVVPPGKDVGGAADGRRSANDNRGLDRDGLRRGRLMAAVCVANWLPRKGILELLEAVAGLPERRRHPPPRRRHGHCAASTQVVCATASTTPTCVIALLSTASCNRRRCSRSTRPSMPSCCRASRSHMGPSGERRWRPASPWSVGRPGTCHSWPITAATGCSFPQETWRRSLVRSSRWPATRRFANGWAGPPHVRAAARPTWDRDGGTLLRDHRKCHRTCCQVDPCRDRPIDGRPGDG